MNSALEKRIADLEAKIKAAAESPIWIDGHGATIRVDVAGKRGKPVTFPTARAAAAWLESQIDSHPQAAGSYSADKLWELYRNPEKLQETLTAALEGRTVTVYGVSYSAQEWPGFIFGQLKTAGPADLKLWLLASGALAYFGTREFRARYQTGEFTEDDAAMFTACYVLHVWERPGTTVEDFWRLVIQSQALEAPVMPVEGATSPVEPRSA